jgi:hypothetical protein
LPLSRFVFAGDSTAGWAHLPVRSDETRTGKRAHPTSKAKAFSLIAWLRDYVARRKKSRVIDERYIVWPPIVLDFRNHGLSGVKIPE